MLDRDPAVIGIEKCGCITFALARPFVSSDRQYKAQLMEVIERGGQAVNTTVGGARRRKNFLPAVCPHKPKGWGPDAA